MRLNINIFAVAVCEFDTENGAVAEVKFLY